MTMTETNDRWPAPGPGMWRADRGHSVGAMTPIAQHIFTNAQPAAFRQMFKDMGVMADTLDVGFVNGHYFVRLRPLVGADKPPRATPPAALLKLMVRLHPEMRRRNRRAAMTLAERPWRATVAEWNTIIRADWERRNLAIQDIDLIALDDPGLANHVEAVVDHAIEGLHTHFVLHGSDLAPIGMLVVFCEERGIAADDAVGMLHGASPSSSEPARLLAELRRQVTECGTTPNSLDELRSVAPSIDDYLRLRGARIIAGYDIDSMTLGEAPDVILSSVLNATPDKHAQSGDDSAADELRSRIPTADTTMFDQLVGEARDCMDMRDDQGPHVVEWPFGLVRLAALEAGRRLAGTGALSDPNHALELTHQEIAALLRRSSSSPDSATAATRAADRHRRSQLVPPDSVGTPEDPPPDGVLPAPADRVIRMVNSVIAKLDRIEHTDPLKGTGIGHDSFVGVVRRADTADEAIASLEAGEVLVVPFTTPMYNVVLPIAGALVTTEGGPLSHAAVLAESYNSQQSSAQRAHAICVAATPFVSTRRPAQSRFSIPASAEHITGASLHS